VRKTWFLEKMDNTKGGNLAYKNAIFKVTLYTNLIMNIAPVLNKASH
jgi:hypothetical protein